MVPGGMGLSVRERVDNNYLCLPGIVFQPVCSYEPAVTNKPAQGDDALAEPFSVS